MSRQSTRTSKGRTKPGVKQETFDQAVEQLITAGTRPTVQRVQEIVGGPARRVRVQLEGWWKRLSARLASAAGRTVGDLDNDETAEAYVRRIIDQARTAIRAKSRGKQAKGMEKIHLPGAGDPKSLQAAYKRAEQDIRELRTKERALQDKLSRLRNILVTAERRAEVIATAIQRLK